VRLNYHWSFNKGTRYVTEGPYHEVIREVLDKSIEDPILADTSLTSILDGEAIWKEIQNYISSLNNEVDVETDISDVDKAVNHGFDKKTSFRHPIK
jgi:hypothetical protein